VDIVHGLELIASFRSARPTFVSWGAGWAILVGPLVSSKQKHPEGGGDSKRWGTTTTAPGVHFIVLNGGKNTAAPVSLGGDVFGGHAGPQGGAYVFCGFFFRSKKPPGNALQQQPFISQPLFVLVPYSQPSTWREIRKGGCHSTITAGNFPGQLSGGCFVSPRDRGGGVDRCSRRPGIHPRSSNRSGSDGGNHFGGLIFYRKSGK